MREVGIDVAGKKPRFPTDDLVKDATLLVTMGCGEAGPFAAGVERNDWPLESPKDKPLAKVREIRDEIRARVAELVNARRWRR